MKRTIPHSGELLCSIGLGTWQVFDVANDHAARTQAREALKTFVSLGGEMVDSSPMYGEAERVVGDLTHELGNREKYFFATKVWTSGQQAGMRQMEQSLRLMRTARMDLMQIHNLLDLDVHTRTLRDWKARRAA